MTHITWLGGVRCRWYSSVDKWCTYLSLYESCTPYIHRCNLPNASNFSYAGNHRVPQCVYSTFLPLVFHIRLNLFWESIIDYCFDLPSSIQYIVPRINDIPILDYPPRFFSVRFNCHWGEHRPNIGYWRRLPALQSRLRQSCQNMRIRFHFGGREAPFCDEDTCGSGGKCTKDGKEYRGRCEVPNANREHSYVVSGTGFWLKEIKGISFLPSYPLTKSSGREMRLGLSEIERTSCQCHKEITSQVFNSCL